MTCLEQNGIKTQQRLQRQGCCGEGPMLCSLFHKRSIATKGYPKIYPHTRPPELVRDFVHDCLYNPTIGYFSKNVNIFNTGDPIQFNHLKDQEEYNRVLYDLYKEQSKVEKFYQLWHTPSELFKPWYGNAVARYMVEECMKSGVNGPLIIYEIGPGNGTLCEGIIEYIKVKYPEIYESGLEYNLIDISKSLHAIQKTRLTSFSPRVKHYCESILEWKFRDNRPCFIIAMEVLDNLPHDRIMYQSDGELMQGVVWTNDRAKYSDVPGKYVEVFVPANDKVILELVGLMDKVGWISPSLRWTLRDLVSHVPYFEYSNSMRSEFIPTGPYQFIKQVTKLFPNHRLVISDFDRLPDTIQGHQSPVVQTRYQGDTVNCSTYLLQRGLFDIFFPINFGLLSKLYKEIVKRDSKIMRHKEFCVKYGDVEKTKTRSNYNPMLEDFENVSMLLT